MTFCPHAIMTILCTVDAPEASAVSPLATAIVWGLLVLSIVLTFIRLTLGPTLPDRVVAMDLLASLAQGVIATYAIITKQAALLDVALAIALISFLGTVAFARYIEKRVGRNQQQVSPTVPEQPEQVRREGLDHA